MNWQAITEKIEAVTGQPFKMVSADAIAGGDINSAYRLQGHNKSFFVKLNRADLAAMFEAEYAGLQAITQTQTVRVPVPVVCGKTAGHSFLVLEYIELGRSTQASDRLLGRQLALLHQQKQPYFGWHRDNTIGSTLQFNSPSNDWLTFWREQRLGFQLTLAANKGYGGSLQANGERLCSDMAACCLLIIYHNLRYYMAIYGRVMRRSIKMGARLFLIPPAIMATGKLIWR